MRVVIAEMAYCPNVELVLCDPKMIEFRAGPSVPMWPVGLRPRALRLTLLYAEMMRRYETIPDDDVEWDDSMGLGSCWLSTR